MLALLGLRLVAGFPGVYTPHTHGGATHTHASGGVIHQHLSGDRADRTNYPIRIAVRTRPADWEHVHTHGSSGGHAHPAPARGNQSSRPSGDERGNHHRGPDRERAPENYYCAAAMSLLAAESLSPLPAPARLAGVFYACTPVKQRAHRRAWSPRGPPPKAGSTGLAFT